LYEYRVQKSTKLQVLFLRANNIQDDDVKQICHALRPDPANPNFANKVLKVLDLSYNPITKKCLNFFAEMMETNRTLEYLGLAKC
jgi:Ran GTPase-activating protein (RanGAP) involved in mRNA processing and transport